MQHKSLKMGAAAIAAACLSACGDHNSSATSTPTPPTPPMTQQLDSAAVLAMAQKTSEVSQPIALNDNAVSLTDTSDTTSPISVDGT
jgi:hypothetical protein